jgi:hypothetical protein
MRASLSTDHRTSQLNSLTCLPVLCASGLNALFLVGFVLSFAIVACAVMSSQPVFENEVIRYVSVSCNHSARRRPIRVCFL